MRRVGGQEAQAGQLGSNEIRPAKGVDLASAAENGLLGDDEIHITADMSKLTKFFKFFGPGLLIATVYVDPGQIVGKEKMDPKVHGNHVNNA